jgi:hypothetical protein
VTGRRSAARTALLLLVSLGLLGCGGRTDAHVVDDLVDGLLARQTDALELAVEGWDGVRDPLTAEVDEELAVALAGRALDRARTTLPAAVADPAAAGLDPDRGDVRVRRFATSRIVRSEPGCLVVVGSYAFRGLDVEGLTPRETAVSLSSGSPDAALGQLRDWRLRDAIAMASFTDDDLADPEVLDSTCVWDR